jgi:hypothetical protein
MPRAVELLGGGILGFIAGSFLCAPLIAHVFGPTTVTWDASACPSSTYTIISTATKLDGSASFTATAAHVQLPQSSIVQEFTDLPFGEYRVTAVARDAKGRLFNSDTQTISGLGPSRGHQASSTTTVHTGYAATAARPAAITAQPSTSLPSPVANRPAAAIAPVERTFRLSGAMAELLTGEPGSEAGLLAAYPQWKSVVFIDVDDDGVVDLVRIEFVSGEVWVAAIGR